MCRVYIICQDAEPYNANKLKRWSLLSYTVIQLQMLWLLPENQWKLFLLAADNVYAETWLWEEWLSMNVHQHSAH